MAVRRYTPTQTDNFNVYIKGVKAISVANGVELPELKPSTETVDGAGILGTFEEPALGQYEEMEIKIPFTNIGNEATALLQGTGLVEVEVRGATHVIDPEGSADDKAFRVVAKGHTKSFTLGKLEKGKRTGTEATIGVTYLKVEFDGVTSFLLDKLNSVCVVNGTDVMQKLREMC